MTDIPQLRTDLVAAGERRRRRARARTAVIGAVTLTIAAAALTRLDAPAERDVAAPASDSERLEQAFGVFRRPATRADRFPARPFRRPGGGRAAVLRSRLVARVGEHRYFLVQTTDGLCLLVAAGGGGCGGVAHYLDGKRPLGSYSDEQGPADFVFTFPDGVRDVAVRTVAGEVRDLEVVDNAVATRVPARASELRWTAPDGAPQRIEFAMEPAVQPADFYSALVGVDEQLVAEDGDARAWLADRDGRVCLRVQAAGEELEGCRDKPADVRRALVVILEAGDRRVLAAAFTDGVSDVRLRFADGQSRSVSVRRNGIVVYDATTVESLRYRNRAEVMVTERLPASAGSAVLNGQPRQ